MSSPLYLTPLGWSSRRPDVALPPIERQALIAGAHALARKARPHFASYREAFAYGLEAQWARVNVGRSIAMLNAQVERRPVSIAQRMASARATRRVGSSFFGQ